MGKFWKRRFLESYHEPQRTQHKCKDDQTYFLVFINFEE